MRDYPNMSYCMFSNTTLALKQILNHLSEAQEEGLTFEEYANDRSSREERAALMDFESLMEEVQDVLRFMKDALPQDDEDDEDDEDDDPVIILDDDHELL